MTLLDPTPPAAPIARTFTPHAIRHELLLTALTPLSHHDASVQDDSNRNLFNRQAVLVHDAGADLPTVTPELAQLIAVDHPVPAPVVDLLRDLTFPEWLAALLVRQFADEYNSRNGGDGEGLFSDMGRWPMLANRVPHAAYTGTLRGFWVRLLSMMQVGLPNGARADQVLRLLAVPRGTQLDVLHVLRTQGSHVVQLARFWHDAHKQMDEQYAAKVQEKGLGLIVQPENRVWVTLTWEEHQLRSSVGRQRRLEVPHLTANSARHQMLREPAMLDLFEALGIEPETLEPGVEAMFYNGGNIAAGVTQPSNPALLARQIRQAYPSVDLLGGVTNAFDVGESLVTVRTILVSAETRHLLPGWARDLPAAQMSAFDLLEDFTLTRQAGTTGEGQMIFGFEGLCAGAQFIVTLDLKPYASQLARGAMMAALERWGQRPVLGGASARGFGEMRIDDWRRPDPEGDGEALAAYRAYLADHADDLRQGLLSGRLGTGAVVVS